MPLTDRESEVLALLRQGLGSREIATRLGISADTARRHTSRIVSKTGIPSAALACMHFSNAPDWFDDLDLSPFNFTQSESAVLRLVCRGLSSKLIARVMGVSPRTIEKHRQHIRKKTGTSRTRALVAWAADRYAKSGIDGPG